MSPPNRPIYERPQDRTQSRDKEMTTSEKNAEIVWVLGEYRKLYSALRIAESNLQVAEQNNRKGRELMNLTAIFNRAQWQLEFALGITLPGSQEAIGRELRWATPELEQLRHRAKGTF